MDEIKVFWERRGAFVNVPGDSKLQMESLVNIQRTWIEKIEEADLIIAVPKEVTTTANGDNKYVLEFGESTSYEIAIAKRFNKVILFGHGGGGVLYMIKKMYKYIITKIKEARETKEIFERNFVNEE